VIETDVPQTAVSAGLAPGPQSRGQAAFRAGWLMAQLYGPIIDRGGGSAGDHLPSVSELSVSDRVELAIRELAEALAVTATGMDYKPDLDAVNAVHRSGEWHAEFKEAIARLHLLLIIELTVDDPLLGHAYCLGRSLSDTAWLPSSFTVFQQQLNPYRVAELDGWLAGLGEMLGNDAVTAVRGSLQAWSAWAADPFVERRKLDWGRDGRSVALALRRQGAVWRDLLCGERAPSSLLTAEAYVGAADTSLRRVGFLARQVLVHFWYAVVFLLAMVGGLIYVSAAYAAGMAKFWGVFAAAAGGSGALVLGIRQSLANLAQRTGTRLGQAERDDALQVGATRLPAGATAGRVCRRVASGEFKRPGDTAIQPMRDPASASGSAMAGPDNSD
jgi:hypothetical protein